MATEKIADYFGGVAEVTSLAVDDDFIVVTDSTTTPAVRRFRFQITSQNLIPNSGFGAWSYPNVPYEPGTMAAVVEDGTNAVLTAGNSLVTNGGFDSVETGWTGSGANLADDASGKTGHCMKVTNTGAAIGYAYQAVTVTVGKLYEISAWFKKGTATGGRIKVGIAAGLGGHYDSGVITDAGWTQYKAAFVAIQTTIYISLDAEEAATNTAFYDSVILTEITRGVLASEALTACCDGWHKDNTGVSVLREHNGSHTKAGEFYALKVVNPGGNVSIYTRLGHNANDPYLISKFMMKTVTFGAWVRTTDATTTLAISDGLFTTSSTTHSGSGSYEWLEVTAYCVPTMTDFYAAIVFNDAATSYVSQPMLVYGSLIGSGNYCQLPGGKLDLDNAVTIWDSSGIWKIPVSGQHSRDIEGLSWGMIPKGVSHIEGYMSATHGTANRLLSLASTISGAALGGIYSQVTAIPNTACIAGGIYPWGTIYVYASDGNFTQFIATISTIWTGP